MMQQPSSRATKTGTAQQAKSSGVRLNIRPWNLCYHLWDKTSSPLLVYYGLWCLFRLWITWSWYVRCSDETCLRNASTDANDKETGGLDLLKRLYILISEPFLYDPGDLFDFLSILDPIVDSSTCVGAFSFFGIRSSIVHCSTSFSFLLSRYYEKQNVRSEKRMNLLMKRHPYVGCSWGMRFERFAIPERAPTFSTLWPSTYHIYGWGSSHLRPMYLQSPVWTIGMKRGEVYDLGEGWKTLSHSETSASVTSFPCLNFCSGPCSRKHCWQRWSKYHGWESWSRNLHWKHKKK